MKRLDQLNILRFLIAMLIVFFHYGKETFPFTVDPWRRIFHDGNYELSFFFVLSGFILTYVYGPQIGGNFNWKNFILKRLTRFYPLYLVAVLIPVPFRFGESPHTLLGLILDIFMLQSWVPPYPLAFNGPAWAMSALVFYYLLFPPVVTWFYKKGLKFAISFVTCFWLASQVAIHLLMTYWYPGHLPFSHDFLNYNPLFHLNAFLVGILGGMLFRRFWMRKEIDQQRNLFWLTASLVVMILFVFFRGALQQNTPFRLIYNNGLIAPLYLLIIILLARDDTRVTKFLTRPFILMLGNISFSIYLMQSPMVRIYQRFLLARLEYHFPWTEDVHFYIYLALLLPASFLTYYLFEIPVQRYIRGKLLPQKQKASAPA